MVVQPSEILAGIEQILAGIRLIPAKISSDCAAFASQLFGRMKKKSYLCSMLLPVVLKKRCLYKKIE